MQKLEQKLKFAVLGGGISGLSSCYYLLKSFPRSTVTLFERNARHGGWLNTTIASNLKIEQGARLIKNDEAANNFMELCEYSNLMDQFIAAKENVNKNLLAQKNGIPIPLASSRGVYKELNQIYKENIEVLRP